MNISRNAILTVATGIAFSWTSSIAVAEQHCKNIESNVVEISAVFFDPAVCNGYEICQFAVIKGSINGKWWAFWNFDDEEVVADGTAGVLDIDDVFETKRGDIYGEERGIINFLAPDGYAAHIAVTGGTGSYVGANGWLTGTLVFGAEIGAPIGGKLVGEICWTGD